MRSWPLLSCGLLGASLITLAQPEPAPSPAAPTPHPAAARKPGSFDQQILDAAQNFKHYTRVSDQAKWAPTLCSAPSPAGALRSSSSDDSTHGKKLYFLFAKDAADYQASAYASTEATTPPKPPYKVTPGQVLVKQSFHPEPVPDAQAPARLSAQPGEREYPDAYAVDHGKFYRTGEPGPLFIMLKLDPGTPDTDEGWVYANTTPDGKTITDAGRIASCMECHTKTTRDRLYGPPWSWRTDPVSNQSLPPTRENVEQVQKLREDAKVNPLPPAADLKPK